MHFFFFKVKFPIFLAITPKKDLCMCSREELCFPEALLTSISFLLKTVFHWGPGKPVYLKLAQEFRRAGIFSADPREAF